MGHPMANQGYSTADPKHSHTSFSMTCTLSPPSLLLFLQKTLQEVTSQDESFMLSVDGFIIKIDAMCT